MGTMQRAIIKNKNDVEINRNDAEDISSWISEGIISHWWGLPQREIQIGMEDDVSPYLSTRIESKYTQHIEGEPDSDVVVASLPPEGILPADIIYQNKFGTLPAEYTVTILDVTQEYNQKALSEYITAQVAVADAAVSAALQGYDRTTIIADNLAQLLIYLNVSGTQTAEEIAAAKTAVLTGLAVYNQMKAIQTTMYTNIAAKKAELGL